MALEGAADKYFSALNPLASRISSDLKETKDSHEHLWQNLSESEKKGILNESIVNRKVLLKYKNKDLPMEENYATKIVVDDHCSYRDEHSGPFSFRTQSQRDLYALCQRQYANEFSKAEMLEANQVQNINKPTKNARINDRKFSITLDEENIILEVSSGMPKTGLDFLDDW